MRSPESLERVRCSRSVLRLRLVAHGRQHIAKPIPSVWHLPRRGTGTGRDPAAGRDSDPCLTVLTDECRKFPAESPQHDHRQPRSTHDRRLRRGADRATLEVTGVAELGGDAPRAVEPVRERAGTGARRGPRGVSAHVQDRTAAVDVSIVAEYGHVVMDVANEVKTNVARTISRMLGMRVVEVNVDVEDVRMPGETRPEAPAEPARHE
ncbi:Asp23/Gls24 family envelope stress response protein [Streptosporangium sp. NBC_01755]|uniref:Asp23/Gls24 family envelope stress response protein n=1 Tax=unclassified Streptosporangium TaxID=2632669 RepID=UPI002DDB303C|nr:MULTISPECIES: Asp23/Gls24 family envelope stress response protein [unclassified Streptosporangium]WSA29310.1 Asp23/Gls24 family envelope stress response protein [Streptosporangium sp. NBC_01810]WSC99247.1 Asp23/Gls24 family envelope stress response protein [Streptosporangium sp. NBC_01755]